jgi:hypothetical protein
MGNYLKYRGNIKNSNLPFQMTVNLPLISQLVTESLALVTTAVFQFLYARWNSAPQRYFSPRNLACTGRCWKSSRPQGGGIKMAEYGLTWRPYNGLEVGYVTGHTYWSSHFEDLGNSSIDFKYYCRLMWQSVTSYVKQINHMILRLFNERAQRRIGFETQWA